MRRSWYLAFIGAFFVFCAFCGPLKFYFRGLVALGTFFALAYLVVTFHEFFLSKLFFFVFLLFCVRVSTDFLWGNLDSHALYVYIADHILMPITSIGLVMAFLRNRDYKSFKFYTIASFLILSFFIVATIRSRVGDSRMSVGRAAEYSYELALDAYDVAMSGVLGYHPIHALPFLLAGFVFLVKFGGDKKFKIFSCVYLILVLGAVVKSGFTVATIISLLLLFFAYFKLRQSAATKMILCFLGLLVWASWQLGLVTGAMKMYLKTNHEDNAITVKMKEMVASHEGDKDSARDMDMRQELLGWTMETIWANPIFGGSKVERCTGDHNFLFDYIGKYGVFGFFFFALFYGYAYKYMRSLLPPTAGWYYSFAFAMLVLMLCLKGQALKMQNIVFFLMLPSLLLLRKDVFYYASDRACKRFGIRPLGMPRGYYAV